MEISSESASAIKLRLSKLNLRMKNIFSGGPSGQGAQPLTDNPNRVAIGDSASFKVQVQKNLTALRP
jgi:hypothetical protein